ncbi:uncharacterized protein LOC135493857 [Lineus longissimus]|uniref:uncharacterized protein LOC135493857 n=1 Tax=Lineus longissimus TaxID=88925 RepID=UPI00315DD9DA
MATRKLLPLPFDVVSDGTDDSIPSECIIMTNSADSGICQDYEQPEDEANALSIVETQCRGKTNGRTLYANTSADEQSGRIGGGKFVLDKKEMMKMVNKLGDLMATQQKTKSTSLTAKVFCKANFAMAIVGEEGGRLFFSDGSLMLVVPRGALAEEKVIYVYKPINSEQLGLTGDTGKVIYYGPTLLCGTEGTTFLRDVKLSFQHYAQRGSDPVSFKVQKSDNTTSPWNVLDDKDVTIHKRTVDVMLSSFSLLQFIVDGQMEAHVPMKAMACVCGVRLLPGSEKVAHVYLVENDSCVIQATKIYLKDKGCKEKDIVILPIKIDPRIDVTFTVLTSNLQLDGCLERATASIRPSSKQLADISLDLSSSATTPAKCIKVCQGAESIAFYNIPDESFEHHTTLLTTPYQADQDFSFEIPPPLSTEELPEEARGLRSGEYSFEVYDGSHRMDEGNDGTAGDAGGESRLQEATTPSPGSCQTQRRGSGSTVGSPGTQEATSSTPSPVGPGGLSQRRGSGSMVGIEGTEEVRSPSSRPPDQFLLQRRGLGSVMGNPATQKATSYLWSPLFDRFWTGTNGPSSLEFRSISECEGAETKRAAGQPRIDVKEQPISEMLGRSTRRARIAAIPETSSMRGTFIGTCVERPRNSRRTSLPEEPARNLLPPMNDQPRKDLSEEARGIDLFGGRASTKAVIPSIRSDAVEIGYTRGRRASLPVSFLQSVKIDGAQALPLSKPTHRTRRASIDVVTSSVRNEIMGKVLLSPLH